VTKRRRHACATIANGIAILSAAPARAQDRRVDDEAVLAPLRLRAAGGFGAARVIYHGPGNRPLASGGVGVNAEVAAGIGKEFEVGVRIGARPDVGGQALRADEVARGYETATFGTGISAFANPELRLRWRAVRWRWLEAGLDERVVLPAGPDPNTTEVLGAWMAAHAPGIARADVGLDGALTWQSFSTGTLVVPAFGIPVRLWFNLTRGLFAGGVVTSRYDAATRYTSGTLQTAMGAVAGYRFGACDLALGVYLLDVVNYGLDRNGAGLSVSCRVGRRPGRSG
jgi:hypothetical protein